MGAQALPPTGCWTCCQLAPCWMHLGAGVLQWESRTCTECLWHPEGQQQGQERQAPGPDPASEGSSIQGSFVPTWKGHSSARADSGGT